ncbi:hypothetical protein MMAN_21090 [Mycobacterium mantenii]|uniref:Uncharacterized protein n=1 Tax=Mycobacterium mantenii TaxID=560555 RepID=A0ABN6A919_MYCNT|nr:hypothetical protein MMAN_21090 [Mycobacterium mantenii]
MAGRQPGATDLVSDAKSSVVLHRPGRDVVAAGIPHRALTRIDYESGDTSPRQIETKGHAHWSGPSHYHVVHRMPLIDVAS